MKSQLTTQQAKELLDSGWALMQHKDTFYGHIYYVKDANAKFPYGGYCIYMNGGVFANLVKLGYQPNWYQKEKHVNHSDQNESAQLKVNR